VRELGYPAHALVQAFRRLLRIVEVAGLGRLDERQEDALVLLGSQFARGRKIHDGGQGQDPGQNEQGQRAEVERAVEAALIGAAQAQEGVIELSGEPGLIFFPAEQLRAHHRRQRQRDEARDDDGPSQGEGEFAKENAGDAGDEADRRIDRGKRDGHGDDRQRDLVRPPYRRVERRHALLDVAVNVLHHHDRVVDHEADAEHQREQGQEID
jgi:hypothetical protein